MIRFDDDSDSNHSFPSVVADANICANLLLASEASTCIPGIGRCMRGAQQLVELRRAKIHFPFPTWADGRAGSIILRHE